MMGHEEILALASCLFLVKRREGDKKLTTLPFVSFI